MNPFPVLQLSRFIVAPMDAAPIFPDKAHICEKRARERELGIL